MCCGQDGQYQSAKEVQAAMELYHRPGNFTLKFIYSEKATKFCEIFTLLLLLSYVVPVKRKMKISQNFMAFSEHMNFNIQSKWQIQVLEPNNIYCFADAQLIFTGDLNVFDGFEQSKTIKYMKGQMDGVSTPFPLEDTFRTGMILI